jgi:hypothetical protein
MPCIQAECTEAPAVVPSGRSDMTEEIREHRYRTQDGVTPGYKAFHEVFVTKDLGPRENEELVAFIGKHIAEFKGHTEDKHGIPIMLFERKQDAQSFADALRAKLNIKTEHITLKARKFTR